MLSVAAWMVRSRKSQARTAASWCKTLPASSKSELVIEPVGFSNVISRRRVGGKKGTRQTRGAEPENMVCLGVPSAERVSTGTCRGVAEGWEKRTPPAPSPDASWAPTTDGKVGTTSAIRVGRVSKAVARARKSSIAWWKAGERRRRDADCGFSFRVPGAWSAENKPREPGRANAMDRSSPKSLCHFFRANRCCVGVMLSSNSRNRSRRRSGREMVMASVSTIHPRMVLTVDQDPSPCKSFFKDTASCRQG